MPPTFYQTLVAAFGEANAALVGPTKIIESVYVDYNPEEPASLGQTINIPLPARLTSQVADIGTGSFNPINPNSSSVSLPFTSHPGIAYVVSDFSQFNTPSDIRKIFLDSALKGILEYINQDLGSLFTPANFSVYPVIAGVGQYNTVGDMTSAWGRLAAGRIPVRDFGNFFGMFHPIPFAGMTGDTTWSANSQVGYQIAGETRRYAMLGEQWGALIDFDPDMPTTAVGSPAASRYYGALFHRHAIAFGLRPLPIPDSPVVMARNIMLKDLVPVRVMLGYNQLQGGWVTTVDAGYARAVIRPDHGQLFTAGA